MPTPETSSSRAEWTQRQQAFGNSPRAVLMKEVSPCINELIDIWHREVLRFAFSDRANSAPSSMVLDVGCGYGRLATEARSMGFTNIVGIDFAEGFCKQTNSR